MDFLGYKASKTKTPDLRFGKLASGKRLKAYRQFRGLSQRKLAFTIGFNPTAVGKWERAERRISEPTAKKLAEALDVDYQNFLCYD